MHPIYTPESAPSREPVKTPTNPDPVSPEVVAEPDVTEGDTRTPLREDAQGDVTCSACDGSGETTVLSGGGPGAYDVAVNCQPCSGSGALEDFAAWLAREMPAGTIIGDPAWWAPRIERAFQYKAVKKFDERYREGYSAGWKEGRDDLAPPVASSEGLSDEQIIAIRDKVGRRFNSARALNASAACEFARRILAAAGREAPALPAKAGDGQ